MLKIHKYRTPYRKNNIYEEYPKYLNIGTIKDTQSEDKRNIKSKTRHISYIIDRVLNLASQLSRAITIN